MTVHIAGSTPADELNGLLAITQLLIDGRFRGDVHLVVGAVKVTGAKESAKNDFALEPIVGFSQIEVAPEEMREQVIELLQALRSARSGKTTMDFPKDEEEPVFAAPLELTGVEESGYRYVVADSASGQFDLTVQSASGAVVGQRFHLPRSVYGEIPPGTYKMVHLVNPDLRDLAVALVREFRSGFSTTEDDVVDAEVVDDLLGYDGEFDVVEEDD